jgi:hypothetical protein
VIRVRGRGTRANYMEMPCDYGERAVGLRDLTTEKLFLSVFERIGAREEITVAKTWRGHFHQPLRGDRSEIEL